MQGSCLCGDVAFEITGKIPDMYQCHCSLCRKVTGSASNTAFVISARRFRWLAGSEQLSSFTRGVGYRTDFCSRCGSPVPNPSNDGTEIWVPAGLLDEPTDARVTRHVFVGSKAAWDEIGGSAPQFDEGDA